MTRFLAWVAALALAALIAAAPAAAHLTPNSVVSLDFNLGSVDAEILTPMSELAYGSGHPLHVAPDGGVGDQRSFLEQYVQTHLGARTPEGRPWRVDVRDVGIASDSFATDVKIIARLTPPKGASTRRFTLSYDGIIDRVPNHFVLVFARNDFATGTLSSEPQMIGGLQGPTRLVAIDRGDGSAWLGFFAAFRLGMRHIAEGHDHLLFLIALILPAPLIPLAGGWGGFKGWRPTLKGLALIVSAFTVGHSITLIGGAFLGWRLPSRPVEIGIALTILISAAHAWRPLFGGREPWLAAGFGLIHGLAFATVIGNFRLEPLAKAESILGFNLGIEFIQLCVVLAVLPALLLLAPTRLYPAIRQAGAVFAGVAATAWIVERFSGVSNAFADGLDQMLGYALWLPAAGVVVALLTRLLGKAPSLARPFLPRS